MLNTSNEVGVAKGQTKRAEVMRIGRFGLVGLINTLIDFGLYNVLSAPGRLSLVQANLISTTVAMIISFFTNRQLVFREHSGSFWRQVVSFYVVTAFGLYVLQTGTIKLLTEVWLGPVNAAVMFAHTAGLSGHDQFVIKNTAKLIGTIVSLAWNYVMYKSVVFL
jgi:putative flippase GtrA